MIEGRDDDDDDDAGVFLRWKDLGVGITVDGFTVGGEDWMPFARFFLSALGSFTLTISAREG